MLGHSGLVSQSFLGDDDYGMATCQKSSRQPLVIESYVYKYNYIYIYIDGNNIERAFQAQRICPILHTTTHFTCQTHFYYPVWKHKLPKGSQRHPPFTISQEAQSGLDNQRHQAVAQPQYACPCSGMESPIHVARRGGILVQLLKDSPTL